MVCIKEGAWGVLTTHCTVHILDSVHFTQVTHNKEIRSIAARFAKDWAIPATSGMNINSKHLWAIGQAH